MEKISDTMKKAAPKLRVYLLALLQFSRVVSSSEARRNKEECGLWCPAIALLVDPLITSISVLLVADLSSES